MPDNEIAEFEMLRGLAPDVPEMTGEAFTAGREQLLAAMADQPPRSARRRYVPWLAAAAVALLIGGAAVVLGRPAAGPDSAALPAGQANEAGTLAGHASDPVVPPGRYRYLRTISDGQWGQRVSQELWIPADPGQEWLMRTQRGDKRAPGGAFDQAALDLAGAPREPQALYDRLRRQAGTPGAAAEAVRLLAGRDGPAPADLRAALLRVLGRLPGVEVNQAARTPDGRAAVEIATTGERVAVLIDPGTGQALGANWGGQQLIFVESIVDSAG